jgi:plasmid stabilization system protein ParE
MRLIYHPDAEAELLDAVAFYEGRLPGLGDRFLRELDAAIAAIREAPDRWRIIEADVRRYTLRRFPYAIYYRFESDLIRVLVVKHHSRHPDYWRYRLR